MKIKVRIKISRINPRWQNRSPEEVEFIPASREVAVNVQK